MIRVDKIGKSPGNLPYGSAQKSQVLNTLPTLSQTLSLWNDPSRKEPPRPYLFRASGKV